MQAQSLCDKVLYYLGFNFSTKQLLLTSQKMDKFMLGFLNTKSTKLKLTTEVI